MIALKAHEEVGDVKRCAIYIRVSTAMQRIEGWSLAAQESSLRAFAKARGWKVVAVYADEGKTARKRLKDRKAIFRLLDDVRAGEVDMILFKELDRWFRSVSDFYKVQDVLDAHGVKWVSERQPNLGMGTKEDRLQVNLLLSIGQNETDSTSDRIKYTNKYMREMKRWTSGAQNLPRCYTVDDDQHVVLDEAEGRAPFVRTLVDYFMQTGSVRTAMLRANEDHGQSLKYGNCITLLRNPMLCGEYKDVPDFVEEPLLTREAFNRMQDMMTRNARVDTPTLYIFAGLISCAECGRSMSGTGYNRKLKDGVKRYKSYRCNHAVQHKDCQNKKINSELKLEQYLLGLVQEAVADRIAQVEQVTQAQKKRQKKKSNRAQIEQRLARLKDLYIEDGMPWEEYLKKKAKIMEKLVEDEPEPEPQSTADLEQIQALLDSGVLELYKDFTPEEKREFWRGILRKVTINDGEVVNVEFTE